METPSQTAIRQRLFDRSLSHIRYEAAMRVIAANHGLTYSVQS